MISVSCAIEQSGVKVAGLYPCGKRSSKGLCKISTSRDLALSTLEILEAILLYLSTRDLLVNGQLVSHTWHNLILKSPSLLQALFFPRRTDLY
jgi:hypothetical protein